MVGLITKLLLVARKDTILVMCDKLSKIIEETLVEELLWLFREEAE